MGRRRCIATWAGLLTIGLIGGCGGSSKTVTRTTTSTVTVATSTASRTGQGAGSGQRAGRAVPGDVIARAEDSVVDAGCTSTGQNGLQRTELGSAFAIVPGNASVFVTASHVASQCLGGAMGANDATVAVLQDDVTHDIALLQENDGGPPVVSRALRLDAAPARVGEGVALIGYSGRTGAIGKVPRVLLALQGTVVATARPQSLVSPQGLRETLTDTIVVAARGAEAGMSGGPAIDGAGRVIGVLEGAGHGIVVLTPARDIQGA